MRSLASNTALTPISASALTPTDNWDVAGDELSPMRGPSIRFDNGAFYTGREKTKETLIDAGQKFVVLDRAEGWQFLKKDCPAEYLLRKPGEDKPAQPFVDECEWRKNLNGEPEHPWRWTFFIYLLNVANGEALTFSTNTNGGRIAVGDLTDQIRMMRRRKPGAVPIIELQSRQMKTKYGSKPRPHFQIKGWRLIGDDQPGMRDEQPMMTATDDNGVAEVNGYDDNIPF